MQSNITQTTKNISKKYTKKPIKRDKKINFQSLTLKFLTKKNDYEISSIVRTVFEFSKL